ncbi:MAG: PEP-utilizing enzyme [Patescibacteria group bacterium]|nr:PEP-utilizing enzyme [Patescibacteria group bacterium]
MRGIVRRVDMPDDMAKMNEGDILVSTATTPSIVPAIRKASAIITDEGGLTCHAAIVSREFEIPCVIGTKIATKVLKDGDLAEVNAEKGLVKIINKRKA